MNLRESWARTADRLSERGIPDAMIESEVLLRHTLGMAKAEFFASFNDQIGPLDQSLLNQLVERRSAREPLAYIVGGREFYGIDIRVDRRVMVPRQETELLVDAVLDYSKTRPGRPITIADVGAGSGALAVAIAHNLPHATVYAIDSSYEALEVADINRRRHGVADRVHLLCGDLLAPIRASVDVVVSNPPYVPSDHIVDLAPELWREPRAALDGGPDGLRLTARLLRQAASRVRPDGMVLVEIAPEQLSPVLELAREGFPEGIVTYDRDLAGLSRMVSVDRHETRPGKRESSARLTAPALNP